MAQNIPVPAEVVRQIATSASEDIHRHRSEGRKATARSMEENISKALYALNGQDGEFISIDATVVSNLTAASTNRVPSYADAARVYLEQYNIW